MGANWSVQQQQIQLDLFDGLQPVWQKSQLPQKASVSLMGYPCLVTATKVGDQLKIDVVPDKSGPPIWPAGIKSVP